MAKKNKLALNRSKVTTKSFLKVSVALLVLLAIAFQVLFNIFMWNVAQSQDTFQTASLVTEALDGVDELKTKVGQDNKIEEMRLQLPAQTNDVEGVRYLYTPEDKSADYPTPQQAQVTTRLLKASDSKLLSSQNTDELFNSLPSVQACSRGFTLQFVQEETGTDTDSPLRLSGTKKLNDGRTLYVYREENCNLSYGVDDLEKYLLDAQSY